MHTLKLFLEIREILKLRIILSRINHAQHTHKTSSAGKILTHKFKIKKEDMFVDIL